MNMHDEQDPGILATCETLHGLATGSLDGVSEGEMIRLETYLQRRLDGWHERTPCDSRMCAPFCGIYDGTVKLLAMTALAEWRACSWHPNASKAEAAK